MKTVSLTLCSFSELSEKAKDRAKHDYSANFGFTWSADYLESLTKLAEHFGGKLADYSVNWDNSSYSSARFEMPDDIAESDIAAKLAALGSFDPATLKGSGDCVLTGFCGDESAIDGFRIAWSKGERSLETLMQAAFREWLKDAQADCAGQTEDAAFSETCDANEWLFLESGALPPKHS